MEYSQVNILLSIYLIIILVAEQRKKIISAQDYLISQSGAAVAEYTRLGLITFQYNMIGVNAGRNWIEVFTTLDRWKKLV